VNYLNRKKLPVGRGPGHVAGTDSAAPRCTPPRDLEEAYEVGRHAVEVARTDGNGWMATILREPARYRVRYDKSAGEGANSERTFRSRARPNRST